VQFFVRREKDRLPIKKGGSSKRKRPSGDGEEGFVSSRKRSEGRDPVAKEEAKPKLISHNNGEEISKKKRTTMRRF